MNPLTDKLELLIRDYLPNTNHQTIFYYGRIVDKHRGHRINLDSLNPLLFSGLPPFYKFKRYTNEALYKAAIAKLKTTKRYSDNLEFLYNGSLRNKDLQIPAVTLYVYLPHKNCDIMIVSYARGTASEGNSKVLKTFKREIVEFSCPQFDIRCIKSTIDSIDLYEVSVCLVDLSLIGQFVFGLFDNAHYKKNESDKSEEEINL